MNNLFSFGCSVTENLDNLPDWSERIIYAKEYVGFKYKCWPELLAEKLDFIPKNYAASSAWGKFPFNLGNTNEDILEALALTCNQFKKDDIIIIQLTTLGRFRYLTKNLDFDTILPSHIDSYDEKQTLIDLLENKSKREWVRPLLNNLNPYLLLSKKIGFKIYIWSNCDTIQEYIKSNPNTNWLFDNNINDLLPKLGAYPITDETGGKLVDYHLGYPGQEILANYIYNKIKNE